MPRSRHVLALAAACLLAAAAPSSALATTHDSHRAPSKSSPAHHFAATGLITAHTAATATVLVRAMQDGRVRVANTSITVALPASRGASGRGHHRADSLVTGNTITVAGTATGSGSGEKFTAQTAVQHAAPAHEFMGTVTAVSGNLATVTKAATSREDDRTDDGGRGRFTVDVGAATITADGAPAGAVSVGQWVAVVGECDHDTVLATAVFAMTAAPHVLFGEVSGIAGSVVMLGNDEAAVVVDLNGLPLMLNGNAGANVDSLTSGARLIVLGSDSGGTFAPALAFAFDAHDRGPAGHHDD
jgi:hypothetical protein